MKFKIKISCNKLIVDPFSNKIKFGCGVKPKFYPSNSNMPHHHITYFKNKQNHTQIKFFFLINNKFIDIKKGTP